MQKCLIFVIFFLFLVVGVFFFVIEFKVELNVDKDVKSVEMLMCMQWCGFFCDGMIDGFEWLLLFEFELMYCVEFGKGYFGLIVSEMMVFVVEIYDKVMEQVCVFDCEIGEEIWCVFWVGFGKVFFFVVKNGDWVCLMFVFDGEVFYVGGMQEMFFKFDVVIGKEFWKVDIFECFLIKVLDFGFVSLFLFDGGDVYVQVVNLMIKFDGEIGEMLWCFFVSEGDMMVSGVFFLLVFVMFYDVCQLLVQMCYEIYGLDVEIGDVFWKYYVLSFCGMNILMLMVMNDVIFISMYCNQSFFYEINCDGGMWFVEKCWENKVYGYMLSLIVIEGYVYLYFGNGCVICIDFEIGVLMWMLMLFGEYWSMMVCGDKIFVFDVGGEFVFMVVNFEEF